MTSAYKLAFQLYRLEVGHPPVVLMITPRAIPKSTSIVEWGLDMKPAASVNRLWNLCMRYGYPAIWNRLIERLESMDPVMYRVEV